MKTDRQDNTEDTFDLLEANLRARYQVTRELAPAGSAQRFLARDLPRNRDVSINVLNREVSAWAGPDRFLQALKPYVGVEHPQLATAVDGGVIAGRAFWVSMQPLGELLDHQLRRNRPMSTETAIATAAALTVPLGYLHNHGLVHGSLTLDSILLYDGNVLVTDAGVRRAINARHAHDEFRVGLGSFTNWDLPDWPEQDQRSDVYSLGAMLYEMISAESPWWESHIVLPGTSVPRLASSIPKPLQSIVYKALANSPSERFPDIEKLADALKSMAD